MNIDYASLSRIVVRNQPELDAIPLNFNGLIRIEFGTRLDPAIVRHRYYNSYVVACGNSSVVACGNSYVVARENSYVEARENSYVVACGNSSVVAYGNSYVVACGNSQIVDHLDGGRIRISGNARVVWG